MRSGLSITIFLALAVFFFNPEFWPLLLLALSQSQSELA